MCYWGAQGADGGLWEDEIESGEVCRLGEDVGQEVDKGASEDGVGIETQGEDADASGEICVCADGGEAADCGGVGVEDEAAVEETLGRRVKDGGCAGECREVAAGDEMADGVEDVEGEV